MKRQPLPISNTNHIVLDLADLKHNPKVMLTTGLEEDVLLSRTALVVTEDYCNQVVGGHVYANSAPEKTGPKQLPPDITCRACRGAHRKHTYGEDCMKAPAEEEVKAPVEEVGSKEVASEKVNSELLKNAGDLPPSVQAESWRTMIRRLLNKRRNQNNILLRLLHQVQGLPFKWTIQQLHF
jgi:hypothetical protein